MQQRLCQRWIDCGRFCSRQHVHMPAEGGGSQEHHTPPSRPILHELIHLMLRRLSGSKCSTLRFGPLRETFNRSAYLHWFEWGSIFSSKHTCSICTHCSAAFSPGPKSCQNGGHQLERQIYEAAAINNWHCMLPLDQLLTRRQGKNCEQFRGFVGM